MNDIFEISDDEDDQEVLRRVSFNIHILFLFSRQTILIILKK
jgi:hypothetical protein